MNSLDVGCGFPNPSEPYKKRASIGIDLKRGYADVVADAHFLPFHENSFGTVKIYFTLDHCREPLKVLKEAHKVASFIVIRTANSSFFEYAFNRHPDEHLYQWNLDTLVNLLHEAGFVLWSRAFIPSHRTWKTRVLKRIVAFLFRGKDVTSLFSNVIEVRAIGREVLDSN